MNNSIISGFGQKLGDGMSTKFNNSGNSLVINKHYEEHSNILDGLNFDGRIERQTLP